MTAKRVFSKYKFPLPEDFLHTITTTVGSLRSEPIALRPFDDTECSGAFIDIASFDNTIPVVLVPDLHARVDFFYEILNFNLPFDGEDETSLTIQEALLQKKVFLVCVGDGLHSEKRGRDRWIDAQKEWLKGKPLNSYICSEMEEGLALMTTIMHLKQQCPTHFHFLKGNHENILNAPTCGNLPFRKFASEGEMVKDFMINLYGSEVTHAYADFENNLPLFIRGANFLVSHAEPKRAYKYSELINAYCDEQTIIGLTWTHNDEAEEGSVMSMLHNLLPEISNSVYFAGHRTFAGTHRALRGGKFIQIHNPNEHFISIVNPFREFNPLTDIYNTKTGKIAENSQNFVGEKGE